MQRRKEISQALKDVSLYAKVRLIRDLNGRKSIKYDSFDNNVLLNAKEQFLDEWTLVVKEDPQNLERILNNALKTSLGKV